MEKTANLIKEDGGHRLHHFALVIQPPDLSSFFRLRFGGMGVGGLCAGSEKPECFVPYGCFRENSCVQRLDMGEIYVSLVVHLHSRKQSGLTSKSL